MFKLSEVITLGLRLDGLWRENIQIPRARTNQIKYHYFPAEQKPKYLHGHPLVDDYIKVKFYLYWRKIVVILTIYLQTKIWMKMRMRSLLGCFNHSLIRFLFSIITFKIIHGFDDVKSETWFNTVGSGEHRLTRLTADPLNLMLSRSRLELRVNFFSLRVVNLWNSLPGEVKNARNP